MDLRFVFVILALIVAAELAEGGRGSRGHGRRGGGARRRTTGSRYVWSRDLGGGNTAEEDAFVPTDRNKVFVRSASDSLTSAGFTKSATQYDFTGNTPKMFISIVNGRRGGPCYLANTTLTYESVIETLTSRNGSILALDYSVSMDGSSAPLGRSEARVFLSANPSLARYCRQGKIINLSETSAAASDTTQVLQVLTLDSVVSLTIPKPSWSRGSSRTRGRGRGSGRRN